MYGTLVVVSFALTTLIPCGAFGQAKPDDHACAEVPGLTAATHKFQRQGETIVIPIRGSELPASMASCEPVALALHWSNGRNNGSNFNVTFLDGDDRPVYAKQISGFLTGVFEFPLSSFDAQPVSGSTLSLVSVPTRITIQAVGPFAAPANLSYRVLTVARTLTDPGSRIVATNDTKGQAENVAEVVSIHRAVRLIGSTRLSLVQIELKTERPFPVAATPLKLRIGTRIFVDELSGDYTGRRLTLSLSLAQFAELQDGDEIVAFCDGPGEVAVERNFGKLRKSDERLN